MHTMRGLAFVVVSAFYTCAFAASVAPGAGITLTPTELLELEKAGRTISIDGRKHYLVDDLLVSAEEVAAQAFQGQRWPGGTVVFDFDTSVANPQWRSAFVAACAGWSDHVPNVRCRQRTNEPDYVLVTTHRVPACVSYTNAVGMKRGARLSIYHDASFDPSRPPKGCQLASHWGSPEVIAHEIGHVFGFVHEHSRWDRGWYVEYHPENVVNPVDRAHFNRIPGTRTTTYTPYDLNSIMHYPDDAFARPGTKTLMPSRCFEGIWWVGSLGEPSYSDHLELQHHYGQPIYDLIRERRDPACGTVHLNPAEVKHYCDDLGEDCGPGAKNRQHRAVTRHHTWWCPGSFSPTCPIPGPGRSCCTVEGKEPFDVSPKRGKQDCQWFQKRYVTDWSCGCPFFAVNARCAQARFGFNVEVVAKYVNSKDESIRILGNFVDTLLLLASRQCLEPDVTDDLEETLISGYGLPEYFTGLEAARVQLLRSCEGGRTSASRRIGRDEFLAILANSMRPNP